MCWDSQVLTIQREKSRRNGWIMQSDLASMHWLLVTVRRRARTRPRLVRTDVYNTWVVAVTSASWRPHRFPIWKKNHGLPLDNRSIDRSIVAIWMKLHITVSSHRMRFELLTARKEKITVLWIVTPCSFVCGGSTICRPSYTASHPWRNISS